MWDYFLERAGAYFYDWYPYLVKTYLILFTILVVKMLIDERKINNSSQINKEGY